ncbi:hypothetical protein EMIT048CA2_160105 [Pseudomonas chlororaphis]
MQGQFGVFDAGDRQHPAHQARQRRRGQQAAATLEHGGQRVNHGKRKHIGLAQATPEIGQFGDPAGIGPGGKVGAVEGPDRRPDHQVEHHVFFDQRPQHPHLDSPEAAATSKDKGGSGGMHSASPANTQPSYTIALPHSATRPSGGSRAIACFSSERPAPATSLTYAG